jgi:hypothetical protein
MGIIDTFKALQPPTTLLSRSLYDLDQNPPPPPEWLIGQLIVNTSVVTLFGRPFGGKSLFALQLALYAAAGEKFLSLGDEGFAIPRQLRVLYVDEESGEGLIWTRTRKMLSGLPDLRTPEILERVRVVSRKGLRLDDTERLDAIRREIDRFPGGVADLVIFDTLRRLHAGEEKDSEAMAAVMAILAELAALGCAILVIHHSKKGVLDDGDDWKEAARGSGDIIAASASVIGMAKTAETLFTLRADSKAGGEVAPSPLILDPETLLYRRQSEDERFATRDAQKAVAVKEAQATLCKALEALRRSGSKSYPASWRTWRDRAKGNASTLAEARDRLIAPDPDTGRDAEVREVKRSGRGGGNAYVFAEDFETTTGTGSRSGSGEEES